VKLFLDQPDSMWLDIRKYVESLESDDAKKWAGRPILNIARPHTPAT
jgi:hypothetical protein